jgi:hypothetical protein
MRHRHQISINNIFRHKVPLLDNKIIISLLPEYARVEIRWHTPFKIVILQKVNKLERSRIEFEFIPKLKLKFCALLFEFDHCEHFLGS